MHFCSFDDSGYFISRNCVGYFIQVVEPGAQIHVRSPMPSIPGLLETVIYVEELQKSAAFHRWLFVFDTLLDSLRPITRRQLSFIFFVVSLGWGLALPGAEPAGDLYQIGIALNQAGMGGSWNQIGQPEAWKHVIAGTILDDRLYTAETDGSLRVTKLGSRERTKIGGPDFGETKFMFASMNNLWTIERNGTLYRVNPKNGDWSQVGAERAWIATRTGTILMGRLYTTETNGTLQVTDLHNGARTRIGSSGFGKAVVLMAAGDDLWMIETDGSLHRVNAKSAVRERVGPANGWKSLLAATIVGNQLYSIRADGTLHEAKLSDGKDTQIGKADFGNTSFLFAGSRQAYTVESDGSLYEVFLHPAESIDDWDCFPREFEKVFQEQAKGFFRQEHPRQLLGNRATHRSIMDQFAWLKAQTTARDLVVIYFTSHGATDLKEGWGAETADGQTLWGHELKKELAKLPCHALVFIETCGSGGFDQPHKDDPPVPANVTALCACSDKQSASNELDIAALEALWGRADFNHDGVVELDELLRYVEARYKVMCPTPNQEGQLIRPVIVKGKNMPGSLRLTRVSPHLGAVEYQGSLYASLVNSRDGDKYHVHILGFNNQPGPYFITSVAPRDCICLPQEGPPLEIEQNGAWYPARLVSKAGDRFKVHYLGYNEEEVVTRQRVRRAFVAIPEADDRLRN
jgi:hypothetical protein